MTSEREDCGHEMELGFDWGDNDTCPECFRLQAAELATLKAQVEHYKLQSDILCDRVECLSTDNTTLRSRLDALVTAGGELVKYTREFKINAASRAAQLTNPTPIAMWSAKGDQLLDALSTAVAAAKDHEEKEGKG